MSNSAVSCFVHILVGISVNPGNLDSMTGCWKSVILLWDVHNRSVSTSTLFTLSITNIFIHHAFNMSNVNSCGFNLDTFLCKCPQQVQIGSILLQPSYCFYKTVNSFQYNMVEFSWSQLRVPVYNCINIALELFKSGEFLSAHSLPKPLFPPKATSASLCIGSQRSIRLIHCV